MKTFAVTSTKFTGDITYTYNDRGFLSFFHVQADLSDAQSKWILQRLPLTIDEIHDLIKSDTIKIIEVPFEVTFEMFWNKYNDKERSSKKKTLQKWVKLSAGDQVKSFLFIDKYNRNRGQAEKKYAETYLNAEMWNN